MSYTLLLHPKEQVQKKLGLLRVVVRARLAKRRTPHGPGRFVQQHRELELMNSFRERFGCDWLQYRNHLETSGTPVLATSKTPALSTLRLSPGSVPGPPPPEKESPRDTAEGVKLLPEPLQEGEVKKQGQEEEGKEDEEGQERDEVEGEQ